MVHRVKILALALFLAPGMMADRAFAAGDPICDILLVLDRLPGHARELLSSNAPTTARSAYFADIERASALLHRDMPKAMPADIVAITKRALAYHRRFVTLSDSPETAQLGARLEPRVRHRIDIMVANAVRVHGCLKEPGAARYEHDSEAGAISTVPTAISSTAPARNAPTGRQTYATGLPTPWLLALLMAFATLLISGVRAGVWCNRRQSQRYHCFISGAMQGHLYCEATEVLDISRTGCKLRLHEQFDPKKPVTLFLGNRTIQARTVWSNEYYAAVKFDTALTPTQLSDVLGDESKPRDGNDLPVPSLPCHTTTCRATCPSYKMMQRQKARMNAAASGRPSRAT